MAAASRGPHGLVGLDEAAPVRLVALPPGFHRALSSRACNAVELLDLLVREASFGRGQQRLHGPRSSCARASSSIAARLARRSCRTDVRSASLVGAVARRVEGTGVGGWRRRRRWRGRLGCGMQRGARPSRGRRRALARVPCAVEAWAAGHDGAARADERSRCRRTPLSSQRPRALITIEPCHRPRWPAAN